VRLTHVLEEGLTHDRFFNFASGKISFQEKFVRNHCNVEE